MLRIKLLALLLVVGTLLAVPLFTFAPAAAQGTDTPTATATTAATSAATATTAATTAATAAATAAASPTSVATAAATPAATATTAAPATAPTTGGNPTNFLIPVLLLGFILLGAGLLVRRLAK